MIISHKYKFIFIKTTKTAGTSIELALSPFLGPDDIITPLTPADEKTRKNLGHRGAQNYFAPFWNYNIRGIANLLLRGKRKKRFNNHISAKKIKGYIDEETWDSYYKFCFERNPWDRFVSLYYWRCKTSPRPSVSEFIASGALDDLKHKGFDLYSIDGKVVVDKVCQFENLSEEMEEIRLKLGIPHALDIPKAKSGYKKNNDRGLEILDQDHLDAVQKMFSDEIELLGYTY